VRERQRDRDKDRERQRDRENEMLSSCFVTAPTDAAAFAAPPELPVTLAFAV
jgi:hypothetical protein